MKERDVNLQIVNSKSLSHPVPSEHRYSSAVHATLLPPDNYSNSPYTGPVIYVQKSICHVSNGKELLSSVARTF